MIPNIINREVHLEAMETQAFTIEANAKAFRILIDGLYKDKIRSVTREIWTNAYDSHAAAGKTNIPFDVSFPSLFDPTFRVKDYGVGLAHEEIVNIYTRLFKSTKENTNEQAGRLGIGSKTPFAYTDSFSIISVKNGIKNYYTAMIGKEGYPAIHKLHVENTDEGNGLEVSFPVKKGDVNLFQEAANYVSLGFEVKPNIVGGSHTWPEDTSEYINGPIAKMGCVIYPIDMDIVHKHAPNKKEKDLANFFRDRPELYEFTMGELEFTASREDLSYGEGEPTLNSIFKKLDEKMFEYYTRIVNLFDMIDCPTMQLYWHNIFRVRGRHYYSHQDDINKSINVICAYFDAQKSVKILHTEFQNIKDAHDILNQLVSHSDIKINDYLILSKDFAVSKSKEIDRFISVKSYDLLTEDKKYECADGNTRTTKVPVLKAFEISPYNYGRRKLYVDLHKSDAFQGEYSYLQKYVYILEDVDNQTKKMRTKIKHIFDDFKDHSVYGLNQVKPKNNWFFNVKNIPSNYYFIYGKREHLEEFKKMNLDYSHNVHFVEAKDLKERTPDPSEISTEEAKEKRNLSTRISQYSFQDCFGIYRKPVDIEDIEDVEKVYVFETYSNKYKEGISSMDIKALGEMLRKNEYCYSVGASKIADMKKYYGDKLIVLTHDTLCGIVKERFVDYVAKNNLLSQIVENNIRTKRMAIFAENVMIKGTAQAILAKVTNEYSLERLRERVNIFKDIDFSQYPFTKSLAKLLDGGKSDDISQNNVEKMLVMEYVIEKFKDEFNISTQIETASKEKIEEYRDAAQAFYDRYSEIIVLHNLKTMPHYEYSEIITYIWEYIVYHKEKI